MKFTLNIRSKKYKLNRSGVFPDNKLMFGKDTTLKNFSNKYKNGANAPLSVQVKYLLN